MSVPTPKISPLLAVCLLFPAWLSATEPEPQFRRPIALQLTSDETSLLVANRRSGTVSFVDWKGGQVTHELSVGKQLSAARLTPDGRQLLVTDEEAHELVFVALDEGTPQVVSRLPVSSYPVDVVVERSGKRAFVSSLWSHRLSAIDLPAEPGQPARVEKVLDLPFAPRCLLLVKDDSRLIVADAFAGRLAIIDSRTLEVLHIRNFPSHNIRGLALNPNGRMLLVAHQMLNELAHTTNNDVHWGLLMSNDLRWLPLDSVLSPDANLYKGAHMHPLGHAGNATGDPSGLAVTPDGMVVVTLGGIDEIAIGKENDFSLQRAEVKRRPTAVTVTRDGALALVANTFADSVSVIDLKKRESVREISLGPQPALSLVDRGELLFYDARLSHDGWMSCHSCHTDGHSNGLLNDNFSDDSFGAPKRVLSLAGQSDTAPFAWNAQVKELEDQVRNSIANTMQGDLPPTDRQVAALAAYVRSLPLPPSLAAARGTFDTAAAERGRQVFERLQCQTCHAPPTFTSPEAYDVGLHDKQGNKEFNPPSLRAVSQRGPYFHDNRAATLEAVLQSGHPVEHELSDSDLRDLLQFLNGL